MTRALCVVLALGAFVVANPARADEAEARRLFDEGKAALDDRRWDRAAELLERSLELHARPSTAFNLALAHHGANHLVRAAELCSGVMDGSFGALDADRRARAEQVCDDIQAAVPVVEIEAAGAPRVEIRIDGEPAGTVADGDHVSSRVDPGRHVITARAPDATGDERVVELDRAERARVSMRVVGLGDAGGGSGSSMHDSNGGSSWGWWLAGGLALAAIAAGVTWFLLQSDDPAPPGEQPPIEGHYPVTMTLRWP